MTEVSWFLVFLVLVEREILTHHALLLCEESHRPSLSQVFTPRPILAREMDYPHWPAWAMINSLVPPSINHIN